MRPSAMGAKTWMIAYVAEDAVRAFEAGPAVDRDASTKLRELFGYHIEGFVDDCPVAADEIPLLGFKRQKRPAWKFW